MVEPSTVAFSPETNSRNPGNKNRLDNIDNCAGEWGLKNLQGKLQRLEIQQSWSFLLSKACGLTTCVHTTSTASCFGMETVSIHSKKANVFLGRCVLRESKHVASFFAGMLGSGHGPYVFLNSAYTLLTESLKMWHSTCQEAIAKRKVVENLFHGGYMVDATHGIKNTCFDKHLLISTSSTRRNCI